jgi:MiaB/RimO family radical SAM methylthiotransferase
MRYKIFGCKVNKYFTDKWLNSEYLSDKTWIFIASCVVTDKAKRKWLKFVKDTATELKTGEKIYISWCGSMDKWKVQQDFFKVYSSLENLKNNIELLPEEPNNANYSPKLNNLHSQIFTKKFLLIQWWCDSFCSFCLTVLKRWRHFFRSKEEIVNEILEFEAIWWKEIVLTGINLWAWWAKTTNDIKGSKFASLLNYILGKTKIWRIRISSLWPEFVNDELLEIFKNSRIYPHFHYSIQSGSSKILSSMRRHYDWKFVRNLLEKTKHLTRIDGLEVSIWADLIVGFPGETETDFMDTYNLVKEWFITKSHIFPFSSHKIWETVPASGYPNQVDEKVKKDRVWKLESIAEQVRDDFINKNIGKEFEVLIEFVKEENWVLKWKWWTKNYIDVDEKNFEVISWKIERNSLIVGKMI